MAKFEETLPGSWIVLMLREAVRSTILLYIYMRQEVIQIFTVLELWQPLKLPPSANLTSPLLPLACAVPGS